MYYVYLVKQPNKTIYTGFSTDLKERIKTHQREKKFSVWFTMKRIKIKRMRWREKDSLKNIKALGDILENELKEASRVSKRRGVLKISKKFPSSSTRKF